MDCAIACQVHQRKAHARRLDVGLLLHEFFKSLTASLWVCKSIGKFSTTKDERL